MSEWVSIADEPCKCGKMTLKHWWYSITDAGNEGTDYVKHTRVSCLTRTERDRNRPPPSPKRGGLTHDEIMVACKNVGVDLTCGACAGVFYTGAGSVRTLAGLRPNRPSKTPTGPSCARCTNTPHDSPASVTSCVASLQQWGSSGKVRA